MVEVVVERELGPTKRAVGAGLRAFNDRVLGKRKRSSLAISVREDGRIVGGIIAYATKDDLFIDMLWIDEQLRGQNIGTRLMTMAESEGRRRGCTTMTLNTLDFQAPRFYAGLGFREIGVIEDTPRGHRNHIFRKEIAS